MYCTVRVKSFCNDNGCTLCILLEKLEHCLASGNPIHLILKHPSPFVTFQVTYQSFSLITAEA